MSTRADALDPLPAERWDAAAAAHLLRRAGFGGTPAEVAELAGLTPAAAVDRLVDFPELDSELEDELAAHGSELAVDSGTVQKDVRDGFAVLRARWLYRMTYTRHPLSEKLALFWHGHFATSNGKVPYPGLFTLQLATLRGLGPGPFRALVGAMARDPVMQTFLDGRLNRRGAPNENFARELLELFTLGVDRYTQRDVDELSRVFTGWGTPAVSEDSFVFTPDDHDPDDKLLFDATLRGRAGEAGIEEGEEALDRIVARPDCARFLARRFLAFFAADTWPDEVEADLAAHLAANELCTREGLRRLFASAWFHAPERRFAQQRSGVELAVAAARLLGVQNVHAAGLEPRLRRLGQEPFNPPSVAGWPTGRARVAAGGLVERYHMALALSNLTHTRRRVLGAAAFDLEALAPAEARDNASLAAAVAERLWQRTPEGGRAAALQAYLDGCDARFAGASERDLRRAKLRGLAHLTVAAPEFSVA
ncbi:MAG TPA: DUF1800 family protein [Planctomycetota bacterium]|nr:DUF1800 family protein [Planctomycetota bacterium]